MPGILLGRIGYERAHLPVLTLKNLYYERAPTNLEDETALIPRPRLKPFAQAGEGPIRGLYRKGGVLAASGYSGAIICRSGNSLYRVTQAGLPGVGTATLIGAVEGGYRMTAEGDESVVVLTCGTKVYATTGAAIAQIAFPDNFPVTAVDTLNSYFLFASSLGRFYWSAIGGTTVGGLDYATAESQPDDLLSLKVLGDELWLMGRLSVEVWQPTGDMDLPFQRIGGRIFGIGVTARETVQKVNVGGADTMCWLGTDRRVYRTAPNPVRISDNALEEMLAEIEVVTAASDANPYATVHSWNGHDFYVLHVPGRGSFAYDLTTGVGWEEWTSQGRDTFRAGVWAVGPNAQPLCGDVASNQIWEMAVDRARDGEDPVVFEFSGLVQMSGPPVRCDNLILDVSAGRTDDPEADPMIELASSADEGRTFVVNGTQPLGRQGERTRRAMWPRLGLLRRPGRVFRWRTTEPVTVRRAKINESWRS